MHRASSSSGKREPLPPLQTNSLRTQTLFFGQNTTAQSATGNSASKAEILSSPTTKESLPTISSPLSTPTFPLLQKNEGNPATVPFRKNVNVNPPASHILLPGALDLRGGLDQIIISKVTKAISDGKIIMAFIDWDDAAVVFEPNGKLKTNYVNTHLVDYLAHLFNTFGVEHFELRILSARLDDIHMSESENDIKLGRLWPVFEAALRVKMKQPFEKKVLAYCIMGWINYTFYRREGDEYKVIGRLHPRFELDHLKQEGKYISYSSKRVLEKFGSVSPLFIQKISAHTEVFVRFVHETKASYLSRVILTEEFKRQYECLHIDDNSYQLQEMRKLNLDITLIQVIPQPRGQQLTPLITHGSSSLRI